MFSVSPFYIFFSKLRISLFHIRVFIMLDLAKIDGIIKKKTSEMVLIYCITTIQNIITLAVRRSRSRAEVL